MTEPNGLARSTHPVGLLIYLERVPKKLPNILTEAHEHTGHIHVQMHKTPNSYAQCRCQLPGHFRQYSSLLLLEGCMMLGGGSSP